MTATKKRSSGSWESKKHRDYKYRDKKRGNAYPFSLEQSKALFHLPCFYCTKPMAKGLDRLDNDKGYDNGNIAPCCNTCNTILSTLPLAAKLEMRDALRAIYEKNLLENWTPIYLVPASSKTEEEESSEGHTTLEAELNEVPGEAIIKQLDEELQKSLSDVGFITMNPVVFNSMSAIKDLQEQGILEPLMEPPRKVDTSELRKVLNGFPEKYIQSGASDLLAPPIKDEVDVGNIVEMEESEIWTSQYSDRKEWCKGDRFHREDGPAREFADGTKQWWKNGFLHRDDGPAIERPDGTKEWRANGILHRLDGPAIEKSDGTKKWYQNGTLHREDGPAIECPNGYREWWVNGLLHREDGPAIENPYISYYEWWVDGKKEYAQGISYPAKETLPLTEILTENSMMDWSPSEMKAFVSLEEEDGKKTTETAKRNLTQDIMNLFKGVSNG